MQRRIKHKRKMVNQTGTVLIVVTLLAVGTGFLGVKYIVSPWMNDREAASVEGENSLPSKQGTSETPDSSSDQIDEAQGQSQPQEPQQPQTVEAPQSQDTAGDQDQSQSQPDVIEDKIDTVATTAFAVQFGSFSTEEAAKQRVSELSEQGITSSVQQRDGTWKVISSGFSTKEEAKAAATQWRNIVGDAFVVMI